MNFPIEMDKCKVNGLKSIKNSVRSTGSAPCPELNQALSTPPRDIHVNDYSVCKFTRVYQLQRDTSKSCAKQTYIRPGYALEMCKSYNKCKKNTIFQK